MDPLKLAVQDIYYLFTPLKKPGLTYTSIHHHLAAIAAYMENREHSSFFKVTFIKTFMEGLHSWASQFLS